MTPEPDAAADIVSRCLGRGFALAGVCDASPTKFGDEIQAWLAAGKQGEMSYLAEHLPARLDPDLILEGARSAIVVADLYHTRNDPKDQPRPGRGRIAKYARGRDYHSVIKKRLRDISDELAAIYPAERFRTFTDTAPVMERELAARAGIGWTGKHTLTINPDLGSYFLLGGILTTLKLAPPVTQPTIADHCGTCTRCIDACPTDAITPYAVDATRCISYLTIEHRSPVDPEFFEPMGDLIAGCDICQDVCPHNTPRPGRAVGERHPDYAPERTGFDLLEVTGWNADARAAALRGSALKRIKLDMFRRNALIAAANAHRASPSPAMRKALNRAASDSSELVRQTARQLLEYHAPRKGRPPASTAE